MLREAGFHELCQQGPPRPSFHLGVANGRCPQETIRGRIGERRVRLGCSFSQSHSIRSLVGSGHGSLPKPWLLPFDPLMELFLSPGSSNLPISCPFGPRGGNDSWPQAVTRSKVLHHLLLAFINPVQTFVIIPSLNPPELPHSRGHLFCIGLWLLQPGK